MKEVYVGCSGFSNNDWKGGFYPENLSPKEYLHFYSGVFNAVEINSTFYRTPSSQTIQNWYSQTPGNFRFFIKIPKRITHTARLNAVSADVNDFCGLFIQGLREKNGGFLFQLPPSFVYSEENLARVLQATSDGCLNVMEFRHASWWTDHVMKALAEKGIVFSGVSIPKDIPYEVNVNHSGFLYYRLHGKPVMFKSAYSDEFLDGLAVQLKNADRTSYIFFNNTWGMSAIRNAQYVQMKLKKL
ncbi:MAG: DUF72 domain-containing protein [Petrimonas sp.]|nr:DUF72 domain-containing protein [Petrimonas sp.]